MYIALSPGAIGVTARTLEEAIAAARSGGFDGVDFDVTSVAARIAETGINAVREVFRAASVRPATCGVPVRWNGPEEQWADDVAALPRLAEACRAIGSGRMTMWILPASDDRPREENFEFHRLRFEPVAKILADHGCRLGLEFIGPKTMRDGHKYPFIWTSGGMLELARAIGPNVGLLLDCWHWHTSGGTPAEISAMSNRDVVAVHINDAPAGIALDEQIDSVRLLPGESGVIAIGPFLEALQGLNYDGPLIPEPFKADLALLADDAARLAAVGSACRRVMATLRD